MKRIAIVFSWLLISCGNTEIVTYRVVDQKSHLPTWYKKRIKRQTEKMIWLKKNQIIRSDTIATIK